MRENALDQLLDRALDRAVADEPDLTAARLDQGRLRLAADLRAAPTGRKRSWQPRRALVAAAVVAVVAAGGIVVQGLGGGERAAAATLNRAADLAASVSDQPVGPDQFRYVRSRARGITVELGENSAWSAGLVNERWIPADPHREWMERQSDDGPATWVAGREGAGDPPANPAQRNGEFRAPCGNFAYFAATEPDRCTLADWNHPTPEFLAGLPQDPKALYDRLVADGGDGEVGAFTAVRGALGTGRYPAAVRALLYRALAHSPNLEVTDDRANLDGVTGTALGLEVHGDFTELVIDPADGSYLGWREVAADDSSLPRGTVRQSTSTTTGVADTLGVAPR
ncbi:CU044_5270 family protein [Actinosynnema sp. NPDC023587]|uniref:CU044_5270 family protein n=1 Tax=Actinosynnema sp. NPDC023587 TaxID=3154695 RepID=UPI0033E0CED4